MNAYIYQAALLCEECGCEVCAELKSAGKRPPDYTDESTYDSDDYPKGPYPDGGGEADCPQCCHNCGIPLENPLTSDGIGYVIEVVHDSIKEAITHGRFTTWDRIMPLAGTGEEHMRYWHGKRHVEIARAWVKQVLNYNLEQEESAVAELFIRLSEPL